MNKIIKIATKITADYGKIAVDLGRAWANEDDHIKMVNNGQFDSYFKTWLVWLQAETEKYYKKNFSGSDVKQFSFSKGRNYIKIIEDNRSVYCFVNTKNGDILKAASWNAPAKHARGNIFEKDSWKNCGPFGPAYLKQRLF